MTWETSIDKFAKKIGVEASVAIRKVAFDIFGGTVRKTPVLTGRARTSWNIALGTPDPSVPPEGSYPNLPKASLPKVGKDFPIIWISTNLAYMAPLENGTSKKAPAGMLAITMAEVETALKSAGT